MYTALPCHINSQMVRIGLQPAASQYGNDPAILAALILNSAIGRMADGCCASCRDDLFYPVYAYLIPILILRLPYSLAVVTFWNAIVYFSTGLTLSAGR